MAEAKASSEGGVRAPRESKEQAKAANSNLAVRIATAAIGTPLILLLLYKGPPWGFFLLALPATLVAAWELFNMTHPGDRASQLMGVGMAAATSAATYFANGDARVIVTTMILRAPRGAAFDARAPRRHEDRCAPRMRDGLRSALRRHSGDAPRSDASRPGRRGRGLRRARDHVRVVRRYRRLLRRTLPRAAQAL